MKLFLTLASLTIIYKSVMQTGDPTNLFSNLLVLYAMYLISYRDADSKVNIRFVKVTKTIVYVVGFICFLGWIEVITVKEVDEQYFITVSEDMRLGNRALINVHLFFSVLAFKMAAFSAFEWIVGLQEHKTGNSSKKESEEKKAKGA